MGVHGPVPQRKDRPGGFRPKARAAAAAAGTDGITRTAKAAPKRGAKQPPFSRDWHKIAKRIWKAAGESGQAQFYEPSDWAVLYSLMDDLTYYKSGTKRSGQMLQTIMSSLTTLLLTEGDRRRLQIELAQPEVASTTPGAEEVERWLSEMSPPSSPTSAPED